MIGGFGLLVPGQVKQLRQAIAGGASVGIGANESLALALQFDVGAQHIDVQADSRFLQFDGLVVEALRKGNTRAGCFVIGHGAQDKKVLRNHDMR